MKIKHIRNVVAMLSALAFTATSASAALVLGFDFQTGTGATLNATGSVQQSYAANFGTGTLYMDGTNGSSTWINTGNGTTGTDTQLMAYYGTGTANVGPGFSTSVGSNGQSAGGGSIGLRQPDYATNRAVNTNGFGIVFEFSMTGYQDLSISYAAYKLDAGAYTTVTWDYSTDGTNWASIGANTGFTNGFAAYSLSSTSGLDDASTAYVRAVFTGAQSNPTGSQRLFLDNIQFNAIPEPGTGGDGRAWAGPVGCRPACQEAHRRVSLGKESRLQPIRRPTSVRDFWGRPLWCVRAAFCCPGAPPVAGLPRAAAGRSRSTFSSKTIISPPRFTSVLSATLAVWNESSKQMTTVMAPLSSPLKKSSSPSRSYPPASTSRV